MPNKLAHFAIEADDVDRARAFYEAVFSWVFQPWGPPEFYLIEGAGIHGALQKRPEVALEASQSVRKGYQCSFAVDDLEKTMVLIKEAGGKILGPSHTIPSVGSLVEFSDTESNDAIIIQYEATRLKEMGLV